MRLSQHNVCDLQLALDETVALCPSIYPGRDELDLTRLHAGLGEAEIGRLISRAEDSARAAVPALPATLYLEFERTGRREGYQDPAQRRRTMLTDLALGEYVEGRGRFLDPLLDVAWAICEEASWAFPAHQRQLADPEHPVVDLGSAMTALDLTELARLLGTELEGALIKLIEHEVDRRILTPYLSRHDHRWMHPTRNGQINNWTAVCTAGVVGSAIHVYDEEKAGATTRLAEILARAARSLDDYLDTFDADGGSSEGPGYWSYGFGYFTVLAHLVEHATRGRIRFLDDERIPAIARYPLRVQLSPRRYVPFSDCDRSVAFNASHLAYLADRLEIPELAQLAADQPSGNAPHTLVWAVRQLLGWPVPSDEPPTTVIPAPAAISTLAPGPVEPFIPARHDWFSEMMWMLARVDPADPNALVLAVKGGHNGEMHNQNDIGSFVVHIAGESVIADPGRGRYTRAYFTWEERYTNIINSSRGHSVPVPNGQAQVAGAEYGATLLDHVAGDAGDLLRLELSGAYPDDADLDSLERTLKLHRDSPGWVELTDTVRFASGPRSFETVLITFGQVETEKAQVVLTGERGRLEVQFDPEQVIPRVDTVENVDLFSGPADLRRVVFAWPQPAQSGAIQLRIDPAG